MILSGDLAKIDYAQRAQHIVFEGTLHKRISHLIFPPFRIPRLFTCVFGQSQLPRHRQQFFGWHSRYWRLYDDGIFVYFESEESKRPLGGVRLEVADLPLTREMENAVSHNLYPAQVNEKCRLTVPSSTTRILRLFTEKPGDCDVLRAKITDVLNNMRAMHTDDSDRMALESRLYRRTSNGSLITHLSVTDNEEGNEDDSSPGSCKNYGIEQLRRKVFGAMNEDVIDEKKKRMCEEIGITLEDLLAKDDGRLEDENAEAGKKRNGSGKAKNDDLEDSRSAGEEAEKSRNVETVSGSGIVLNEDVIQDNGVP